MSHVSGALLERPAFVLGLFDTGLAVIRALARAGIGVRGFDHEGLQPGFASRFGRHTLCPHPVSCAHTLAELLVSEARVFHDPPVLYPTSDAYVEFVSDYRDVLEPHLAVALPSKESVAAALDKARQYQRALDAGVQVPKTWSPTTMEAVRALARDLPFPVVVKPSMGHVWREHVTQDKVFRIDRPEDLLDLFETVFARGQCALIQSLVVGPNTNHSKVCAYIDRYGNPLACVAMRKIRQYPTDFGVGTMVESVEDRELTDLALRFLRAMNWRGPGSIEFKRDERDGTWKLIELNPRLWQQHSLAAACGVNFPLIQYRDLTGQPPSAHHYRLGVRWLDEFRDLKSAWDHARSGRLTLLQWLRSLRGVRDLALFAADDPNPFFVAVLAVAAGGWRRLRNRLRKAAHGPAVPDFKGARS